MKRMDTRKAVLPLAAVLVVPGAALASIPLFKQAYLNYVNVDVDYSQRFVNPEGEVLGRLESDRDSGLEIAAAWAAVVVLLIGNICPGAQSCQSRSRGKKGAKRGLLVTNDL